MPKATGLGAHKRTYLVSCVVAIGSCIAISGLHCRGVLFERDLASERLAILAFHSPVAFASSSTLHTFVSAHRIHVLGSVESIRTTV